MKTAQPKVGTKDQPALQGKEVADFSTPDAQRVASMKETATNEYDPEVNNPSPDPSSRSYADKIRERRAKKSADSLKGKSPPLGHVESPPTEKMQAIASLGGMPRPNFDGVPPMPEPSSEQKPEPKIKGVGSGYSFNQDLAQGKTSGPISMSQAKQMAHGSNLSPESVQALKMAQDNVENSQTSGQPTPPHQAPPAAEEAPPEKVPSVAETARTELDEAAEQFNPEAPDSDFGAVADIREGLMSPERRKDIESRLEPLNIADMITKQEITQKIPIIPDKLSVTLRTFNQRENLWILKYIYDYPGSAFYMQELLNTCRLVCGLVSVNDTLLPDHRKDPGGTNEDIIREDFERKLNILKSFPVQLVAEFSVQSIWFQDRVDKLFSVDALKNG